MVEAIVHACEPASFWRENVIAVVILQLVLARMSWREQVIKYEKFYLFMSIVFFFSGGEAYSREYSTSHATTQASVYLDKEFPLFSIAFQEASW